MQSYFHLVFCGFKKPAHIVILRGLKYKPYIKISPEIYVFCVPENIGMSNGIFFCTMFTAELFNRAKPTPCLLLGRNS